jgi:hypothetical protein
MRFAPGRMRALRIRWLQPGIGVVQMSGHALQYVS